MPAQYGWFVPQRSGRFRNPSAAARLPGRSLIFFTELNAGPGSPTPSSATSRPCTTGSILLCRPDKAQSIVPGPIGLYGGPGGLPANDDGRDDEPVRPSPSDFHR